MSQGLKLRWIIAVVAVASGIVLSFLLTVSRIDSDQFYSAVVVAPVCILVAAVCTRSVGLTLLAGLLLHFAVFAACAIEGIGWPPDEAIYGVIGAELAGGAIIALLARQILKRPWRPAQTAGSPSVQTGAGAAADTSRKEEDREASSEKASESQERDEPLLQVSCRPYGSKLLIYNDRILIARRPLLRRNVMQSIPLEQVQSVKYSIGVPLLIVPWLTIEHTTPEGVKKTRVWFHGTIVRIFTGFTKPRHARKLLHELLSS